MIGADEPPSEGGTPTAAAPGPAGSTAASAAGGAGGGTDDEVALPSAEWLFSDGRALIEAPQPSPSDTRPLWYAVLLGLLAGTGLTATASVVVNNLEREHPEG